MVNIVYNMMEKSLHCYVSSSIFGSSDLNKYSYRSQNKSLLERVKDVFYVNGFYLMEEFFITTGKYGYSF